MKRFVVLLLAACAHPQPVSSAPPPASVSLSPSVSAHASASGSSSVAVTDAHAEAEAEAAVLPIPARTQSPDAPPSGWCGETAIQEALLHLGVWSPQRFIHAVGKPKHPDLYSDEIPIALSALGVQFTFYAPKHGGFVAYSQWVSDALDGGDPVLAGVKILPTEHPDWGLDHFVLVVGHGSKGLLVNTTWGNREWVADTETPGLSLKNAFYAIRLRRIALPKSASPARLTVLEENESIVRLRIECADVKAGASVRVERRKSVWGDKALWSKELTASSERIAVELEVEADQPARFRCVAL